MSSSTSGGDRLQKIIAQAGITSRRDAEELIRDGQVTVNGKTSKLGDKAVLGQDSIKVKGKLLHATTSKVYYLFYKPKNVIAMIAEDEEGRPTIKDFTARIKERVFTIGRMDFAGEGAILLTNDGDLAQRLQKSTDIIRRYHVKVDRNPSAEDLQKLARGGRIDGRSMQPFHIRVVENYARNALIEISFEGMGSIEIKKYFENKGFFPEKVARIGIGHINATNLLPGTYKRLEASSVEALFAQPELAKKQIERLVAKRTESSKAKVVREEDLDSKKQRRRKPTTVTESGAFAPRQTSKSDQPARTPRGEPRGEPRDESRGKRDSAAPRGEARSNRDVAPRSESRGTRDSAAPRGKRDSAPRGESRGTRDSTTPRGNRDFAPRGESRGTRDSAAPRGNRDFAPRGESRGTRDSAAPRTSRDAAPRAEGRPARFSREDRPARPAREAGPARPAREARPGRPARNESGPARAERPKRFSSEKGSTTKHFSRDAQAPRPPRANPRVRTFRQKG